MIKKIKSSEKWKQLLASVIVTPNPFVVPNEILDEISIASSGMLSKMGQDQSLAVLPNMVSSGRSLPVLEAKQSLSVGSSVLENWADQMKTELSSPLISGVTSGGVWKTITNHQRFVGWMASTLVSDAIFKIKLAHVKTVFQSVHGFLGAKSVSKDNMKLFCVEFASQMSLEAAFLVKLTSSVYLTTLKIPKSLVISESGSPFATVVLHNVLLGVSAADIKTAFSVFGSVTCVVLKSTGIWQYVVVYFEKLDSAVSVLNYWSVLVSKDSVRILPLLHLAFKLIWTLLLPILVCLESAISGRKLLIALKMFKPYFVGSLSYTKASAPSVMSEFSSLVASVSPVAVVNSAVRSRLDSLEKQISDLAALVKSIVEPVGSLIALVSCLLDDNAVKTVQSEKNFLFMKYAFNNFANLLVGMSKNIACLRSEIDFGGMDYDDI
ncbi:hypothetical protein G9A89_005124 [Geosiphon pyriformis]|nr:hypothetical protein G9A89_005124 [Geosiphon pyriformis]